MLVISILSDYLLTNYLNYEITNISIFPMFTITYIIYQVLLERNITNIIIPIFAYSILSGLLGINLLYLLIINHFVNKYKNVNYIYLVIFSLIIYDSLYYLLLNVLMINTYNINILIIKMLRSIPINLLYFLILYYNYCTKNKNVKYKYNEMIIWSKDKKKKRKKTV